MNDGDWLKVVVVMMTIMVVVVMMMMEEEEEREEEGVTVVAKVDGSDENARMDVGRVCGEWC